MDVWIDTYANYPPTVADSKTTPAIVASGVNFQSGDLNVPVASNSVIRFNVATCTSIQRCLVGLKVNRT